MKGCRVGAIYCMDDFVRFLPQSVAGIYKAVDQILVMASRFSWSGTPVDLEKIRDCIDSIPDKKNKITFVEGNWNNQVDLRNAGLQLLAENGCNLALIIDGDEIYDSAVIDRMIEHAAAHDEQSAWSIGMVTYWKSCRYKINPPEPLYPVVLVRPQQVQFTGCRDIDAHREPFPQEIGVMHHLSYVRTDEEIIGKIARHAERSLFIDNWYIDVWKKWDENHLLQNLHPTDPSCYRGVVEQSYFALPEALCPLYLADTGICCGRASKPAVSVIIPAKDQVSYTLQLVDSLLRLAGDIPFEIVIVDSGSSRETLAEYRKFPCKVVKYDTSGDRFRFNRALNLGARAARGDALIFANNDVVVGTRGFMPHLARMLKDESIGCIMASQKPHTEALREATGELVDIDTNWIYGAFFSLSRRVYDRIGGFSEEYDGYGCEEHDLGMKLRRRCLRLVHMASLQVAHAETVTFNAHHDPGNQARNCKTFESKWGYVLGFDPYEPGALWQQWYEYTGCLRNFEDRPQVARGRLHPEPRIGVGVITCNRREILKQTMDGLFRSLDSIDSVVFVSDDGSTDGTGDLLREMGVPHESARTGGFAATKNRALRYLYNAGCDCIFLLEDDCIPHAWGWPLLYAEAFEYTPIKHFNFMPSWGYAASQYLNLGGCEVALLTTVTGVLMSMTREAVEIVGGFDERFERYGGEHREWTNRAALAGLTAPIGLYAHLSAAEPYFNMLDWPKQGTPSHKSVLSAEKKRQMYSIGDGLLRKIESERNYIHISLNQSGRKDI